MVAQQQEVLASVMKGKRTKRPRAASLSPAPFTALADEGGPQNSSDTSSVEWAGIGPHNTEEEDMAHCLILLAQGSKPNDNTKNNNMNHDDDDINTSSSNKGIAATTTTYDCKTCNKSFPSFQALGGHRASHKKPKLSIALPDHHHAKKSTVFFSLLHDHHHHHHDDGQFNDQEIALSLQLANGGASSSAIHNNNNNIGKAKVHECSICGAEFSSGQALGGHMRRHRPIGGTTPTNNPSPSLNLSSICTNREQEKTRNNILSLDLNLPAPEDEHQHQHRDHSKFVFPSNEKTLVFSASSLVDCHY